MLNLFQHLNFDGTPKQVRGDVLASLLEAVVYRIVDF